MHIFVEELDLLLCTFDKARREIHSTTGTVESSKFWQCVLHGTQDL